MTRETHVFDNGGITADRYTVIILCRRTKG